MSAVLWLENLKDGDMVTLDGYYSHTFPNTMPYDGTFTFGLDGENKTIARFEFGFYNKCWDQAHRLTPTFIIELQKVAVRRKFVLDRADKKE